MFFLSLSHHIFLPFIFNWLRKFISQPHLQLWLARQIYVIYLKDCGWDVGSDFTVWRLASSQFRDMQVGFSWNHRGGLSGVYIMWQTGNLLFSRRLIFLTVQAPWSARHVSVFVLTVGLLVTTPSVWRLMTRRSCTFWNEPFCPGCCWGCLISATSQGIQCALLFFSAHSSLFLLLQPCLCLFKKPLVCFHFSLNCTSESLRSAVWSYRYAALYINISFYL